MKFDVHHAGAIGGQPYGAFIKSIDAATHSEAKTLAERTWGRTRVVVLPHRPMSERLERAVRRLDRHQTKPDTRRSRRGRRQLELGDNG